MQEENEVWQGYGGPEPVQIDPAVALKQYIEQGDGAFDAEDYETALEAYHAATLIEGHDPKLWSSLGLAYSNLGLRQEAWRSFKLALQVNKEGLATPLWYAGEFLFNEGDYPLAAVLLSRYAELEQDPEFVAEARRLLSEARTHFSSRSDLVALEEEFARGIEDQDLPEPGGSEVGARELNLDVSGSAQKSASKLLAAWRGGGGNVMDQAVQGTPDTGMVQDPAGGADEPAEGSADEEEVIWGDDEQEGFVADLSLQLTGFAGTCSNCSIQIPRDAPYCYSCKRPHFYNEE
jgi:tetratricopeptide (TPR) repeat protein